MGEGSFWGVGRQWVSNSSIVSRIRFCIAVENDLLCEHSVVLDEIVI